MSIALSRRTSALVLAGIVVALWQVGPGIGSEPEPDIPPPRVCWFSDYEAKQLSNQCRYKHDDRTWYMTVDGEEVPAYTVPMPEANLCHYFHGTSCPPKKGRKTCMSCEDTKEKPKRSETDDRARYVR